MAFLGKISLVVLGALLITWIVDPSTPKEIILNYVLCAAWGLMASSIFKNNENK